MNALLVRKAAASLAFALLAPVALGADRSADAAGAGSIPTSRELSPFLEVFLSRHHVQVVTQSVGWVSAVGEHRGLLARDDTNERLPALLLIDDGPAGDFAKHTALELAGIGYVVLLVELEPGLVGERGSNTTDDGAAEAERERVLAQVSAAVRWLRRRDDVFPDRIGALGWNATARWVLEAAAAGGLQAAVLSNPRLPIAAGADLTTGLRHTAVLIVRGTADSAFVDGEFLARLKRQFEEAGIVHDVREFDQANAGFMRKAQPNALDAELADRAWFEIYEYLGKHVEDVAIKGLLGKSDSPDDGRPFRQFASIADLMRAINTPTGVRGALAQSLADEPQSEKDWQQARARAALMTDAGELLTGLTPPKGNLATWQRHVASYRDAAAAIAVAADRHDYSGARQALDRLAKSCGTCHLDHR